MFPFKRPRFTHWGVTLVVTLPLTVEAGSNVAFVHAAAGYALATVGPASVAGSTLLFTPPPAIRAHWQARSPYAFVLYAMATPTPAASSTGFTR